MARDNTGPDVPRGEAGKWLPGTSPNPGGRPKKLREIEEMLDAEHRTVAGMRDVFARLKALAMGEVISVMDKEGGVTIQMQADAAFMKLYLDRVLGPVREEMISEAELVEILRGARWSRRWARSASCFDRSAGGISIR